MIMPATINKVILMGRIGRVPSWSTGPRGATVCQIALATDDMEVDWRTGVEKLVTHWHRVVLTGELALSMRTKLEKGDTLYVAGRAQTRKWNDPQGIPKYINEVVAIDAQVYPKPRQNARPGRLGEPKLTDPDIAEWIASFDLTDARIRIDSLSTISPAPKAASRHNA